MEVNKAVDSVFLDAISRLSKRKGEVLRIWIPASLDRSAVERFREAVGWPHGDPDLVPPTMLPSLFRERINIYRDERPRETIDDALINPVNGGTELRLTNAPRIGQKVSARSILADVYQREGRTGPLGFVVTSTEFSDELNQPIATLSTTMIYRGVEQ